MRKLQEIFRTSFPVRVSVWVVLTAAFIFLAAQLYVSYVSRKSVWNEAVQRATQVLENSELRLTRILDDVEQTADNVEWLVYRHLDSPDTLFEYTRNALQGNSDLIGCAIAFEPYYFDGQEYFSAYSSNTDGVIETSQEGDEDYQYFYLDWYLMPKLLNQPCWTEPYCDWDYDDDYSLQTDMLISYSKPLTDANGDFIGVVSLDVSPKWLSEQLSSVKPYPHSGCVLISRGGTFLIHPDQDKLFYETIFTQSLLGSDPALDKLGQDMLGLKEGFQEIEINGKDSYAFYKPLKNTGWSLALICLEKDIFGAFDRLRIIASLLALLGLLTLFFSNFKVIDRTMVPLKELAVEAGNIAEGDFGRPIPQTDREDEIGTLSRSFAHMQSSLVSYIDELKETTAKKERIEGELRIAHDIQMGMVPNVFPPFPERKELDLHALMTPAREVGGDLYDYLLLGDKLFFCIGDVSGKGIPASMFMATTRSMFRVMGKQGIPPSEVARRLNDTLSENNESMMFVTAFIGVLDLVTGRLDYCNCGHNPPALMSDGGTPVFLDCVPNTPLGAFNGWDFQGQVIDDLRGSLLFLYTDGLNEAENVDHVEFGMDRIASVLSGLSTANAVTVVESMQRAVAAHVGKAEQSDDLTMLCLRLKAKA
ncbi:MAG: SpoIIE family protein phosphatase [Bacteroidales bacterium]|nr:SpoIIE family protein phosphatase [Bacteroidales bacterium]